ncbi:hypothetical protein AB0D04_13650 [Streptomyces sp. NPDC048483]|uniref:hypothetical protein n=1 Tax=Streptomyces sp. NPDC048483 TaxID=3154927 RepID=UPI003428A8EF
MTLSARITRRVERDFPQDESATVAQLLEELVKSVTHGWLIAEERIAAAVLLYSQGDADRFAQAADYAQRDWRDLLVVAELANEGWQQRIDDEFGMF